MPESMFLGNNKFSTAYDDMPTSGMFDEEDSFFNKENAKIFAQGTQAGGLGSGLMSVGIMGANPYAFGGGLVLSQVEALQKSKQAAEQARVQAEEEQKKNQLAAINTAISASRGLA